ncbi:HFM1-like protein, partial [Mya arenaria]
VMYSDRSLVLCSPTGSGKTAVFEMAIVRLLSGQNNTYISSYKIVYMAPIKALCSERYADWREKFEAFGLKVMELTGDTDLEDFYELQQEKWDSMTRKWRENKSVMQAICLFLVDEVSEFPFVPYICHENTLGQQIHVLNDRTRGSVIEAVMSRMKTIEAARERNNIPDQFPCLRFLAVSATITNIDDIAAWLGKDGVPALHY